MSQVEVVCAIFYLHQTSGTCAGMCACYRMHQMEKTVLPAISSILPAIFVYIFHPY